MSRTKPLASLSLSPMIGISVDTWLESASCTVLSASSTPSMMRVGSLSMPSRLNSLRYWSMMSWTFGTLMSSILVLAMEPAALLRNPCRPAVVVLAVKCPSWSSPAEKSSRSGRSMPKAPVTA